MNQDFSHQLRIIHKAALSQPQTLKYSNHSPNLNKTNYQRISELSKDNVVTKGNVVKKPYHRGKNRESTLLGPPAFLTKVLNYMSRTTLHCNQNIRIRTRALGALTGV